MTILLSYLFLCSAISKVLLLCNIFTNILSQWLLSPILDLPKPRNFIPRGYYSFESTFSTPDELHSYFRTESASGLNYLQCWSIHSPWSFTKLWGCENETLPLKSFTRHKVQCTRWQKAQFLNQDARPLILEFSSVQSLSHVQLFVTPWTAARQASLSITNSRSLPKPMSIESVMPSNHLILCRPLFLLPSIFPSIRVFSNESVLRIRWPNYWSFSFNISPSNEYSGLISFRKDWLDLLAVQGTLKSLLQHHSSKASILLLSAFFMVQLSHPHMTTGKTTALTRQTFVDKVMSLLFNMLSRLVITFLPGSKRLLISWLQSPSAVILEPQKNKVCHCFLCFPKYLPWSAGTRCHNLSCLNVELYANFFTLLFHFHQEAL